MAAFLARSLGSQAAHARLRSMGFDELDAFFVDADDDFPGSWINGVPQRGRAGDALVVWAARQHNWPPDVTRRQTLRDLALVQQSYEGESLDGD